MSYYLSPALATLRSQINSRWPKRDKASDGWIGDASHSARPSDHNPDYSANGIVRAIDVDKDGVDMDMIISIVITDPRTWYVIWNGRIRYGTHVTGVPQGWRTYTGSNRHDKHMHISVRKVGSYDSDSKPWKFPGIVTTPKHRKEDKMPSSASIAKAVWSHEITTPPNLVARFGKTITMNRLIWAIASRAEAVLDRLEKEKK